ncbi:MAG: DUF1565 domain-containing protein, partial [Verrucomicrobia bacterium]|nr:DUF1565 domain-containing protein [Verrucomicrobiota bacterium]
MQADLIYVRPVGAGGAASGASWADAHTNLQSALAAAVAGDELWVAAGVYRPTSSATNSFLLKADVGLYGGFTGAETSISQRNWRVTHTILSGDLLGDDTAAQGQRTDNAIHVVRGAAGATLDGVIVLAGNAPVNTFGGGMVVDGVNMTIRNCVFADNTAHSGGALFFDNGAAPLIADCLFSGNSVHGEYAGVAYGNNAAFPEFRRCVFTGNRTSEHGGVFYTGGLSGWSLQAFNCLFAGNYSGWDGGVAYFRHVGPNPQLGNCTFAENTRALCVNGNVGTGGNIKFYNSVIWSNTAYQYLIYAGRINTSYTDLDQAADFDAGNTIRVDPLWQPEIGGAWTADGLFFPSRGLTILTDSNALWGSNAFIGRSVEVDTSHAEHLQFIIASNTTSQLFVWGDASATRSLAN